MTETQTIPLNYCTRCGDELTDVEKEVYGRPDVDAPPICRGCVEEMLGKFTDAMIPPLEKVSKACGNVVQSIIGGSNE